MGKSFWISIAVGLGFLLVGGSIGVIASVWPEYIKPHPYWVFSLLCVGAILMISPLLGLAYAKGYQTPPQHLEVKENLLSPEGRAGLRSLILESIEDKDHFLGTPAFGDYIFLMPVENPMPSIKADNVCATIRFTGNHGLTAVVPRAFWYGHLENEITIALNHVEKVVIGKYVAGNWIYYKNDQRFKKRFLRHSDSAFDFSDPQILSIPVHTPVEVEVEILNNAKSFTYFKQKYRIDPTEKGCTVRLWQ